jgi:hypothetical protein
MAFLTILLALLGFAFFGFGAGSGGVSDQPIPKSSGHHAVSKCSKRMGADSKGCKPANP